MQPRKPRRQKITLVIEKKILEHADKKINTSDLKMFNVSLTTINGIIKSRKTIEEAIVNGNLQKDLGLSNLNSLLMTNHY